ncbi:MAG: Rieske 2Fe-2S domain-containing protein [Acidimicrobiales bacterium]
MPDSTEHDGHAASSDHGAPGAHEPPKMVEASLDSPQFQVAAANPERVERGIAVMFLLGVVGFAGFGAAFWQNWSNVWLGVTLAVGFFGLGIGMVAWGKYLMPRGPFSESRHTNEPTEEEREAYLQDLSSRGKIALGRRSYLLKILSVAGGIFGIVAIFPLLRSLGPLPGSLFYNTAWKKGSYLVSPEGRYVHIDDLDKGGVLTVFPENDVGGPLSQTILIRPESSGYVVTAPGRETWGPEGYLAFSKVCTHAGCPVALYQKALDELLCPCHQSIFEVGPGRPATPVFGPAPRPLPQLPLYVDSKGYLRAQNRYDEPVGPGFWERDNT